MEMFDLLKAVPDVIWSGVIASVLTLGGVFISNSSNTKTLKIQLAYDATEKDKDRKTMLRREVYLNVVEESVKANSYLASLPSLDLASTNFASGLQGFFVAAAKLELVADSKTVL
jgi:hypothetical protein